ncbi:MAG: PDZ domain-containing protein [Actinobacteria bacterium]|nr:PDZ domain-containing protein [Actinomycetota bacterium]
MRFRYVAVALVVILVVATGALYTVPADDFLFTPGQAKPLREKVRVEGARPASGGVFYVDVFVRRATLLEQLFTFTQPEGADVIPEHALLPSGTSEAERDRQNALDMQESERIASAVALRALGYDVGIEPTGVRIAGVAADVPAATKLETYDVIVGVDGSRVVTTDALREQIGRRAPGQQVQLTVERDGETIDVSVATLESPTEPGRAIVGIEVSQKADIDLPIDVEIDLGDVGGPSAGLPFALEVARMLGKDVARGCEVAATGELALDGTVLQVGGLKQKTIGARATDVDVFLVPVGENAQVARKYANRLPVIPVESFQQALRKLATVDLKC